MSDSNKKQMKTGIIGTVVAALCCFTPVLVILFGAVGLSAWLGWIDYVLFPALFASLGLVAHALYLRAGKVGLRPTGFILAAVVILTALLFWLEFRFALRISIAPARQSVISASPRMPEKRLAAFAWYTDSVARIRFFDGIRGDDDLAGFQFFAVDGDKVRTQPRRSFEIGNVVIGRQDIDVLALAEVGNDLVFLGDDRPPIGYFGIATDAGEAVSSLRVVYRFCRPDQVFRRHAADVDAGAADGAVADQRHIRAKFRAGDRRRKSRRPGPNHRKIVLVIRI